MGIDQKHCTRCGKHRTVWQIREILNIPDGVDILAVVKLLKTEVDLLGEVPNNGTTR
jgi:hypothetical protein